jgi:hypothetical protein
MIEVAIGARARNSSEGAKWTARLARESYIVMRRPPTRFSADLIRAIARLSAQRALQANVIDGRRQPRPLFCNFDKTFLPCFIRTRLRPFAAFVRPLAAVVRFGKVPLAATQHEGLLNDRHRFRPECCGPLNDHSSWSDSSESSSFYFAISLHQEISASICAGPLLIF